MSSYGSCMHRVSLAGARAHALACATGWSYPFRSSAVCVSLTSKHLSQLARNIAPIVATYPSSCSAIHNSYGNSPRCLHRALQTASDSTARKRNNMNSHLVDNALRGFIEIIQGKAVDLRPDSEKVDSTADSGKPALTYRIGSDGKCKQFNDSNARRVPSMVRSHFIICRQGL
jgi:hypothetical protein